MYSFISAFMNGKSVHSSEVQICASDITNLEILAAPSEQPKDRKTSGGSTSKQSGLKSTPSKVSLFKVNLPHMC